MNYYLEPRAFFLYAGILLLAVSAWFHARQKEKAAFWFILSSGFFLFLAATLMYPVLNPWDERFHAVVAMNLGKHPLMPTLYDELVITMKHDWWDHAHIWLHKQPLFMWQIAVSYKIFGVNEFALRFPSLVMGIMTIVAVYRSGKILRNAAVGYYAAFLLVTCFYWYELVAGWQHTDHNDVAFFAYVSLSLWSWLEYLDTGKRRWLIMAAVFCGFAILCKWLVGLLLYAAWGIYAVLTNGFKIKQYADLLLAFFITVVVAYPWQWLIYRWYPAEAKLEADLNMRHFYEPFEGHSGDAMYHFDRMDDVYGIWAFYALLPAFAVFIWRARNRKSSIALLSAVVIVYTFFTFVPTKMPSFTVVAILPMLVALAFLIEYVEEWIRKIRMGIGTAILITVLVTGCGVLRIDLVLLNEKHDFFQEPKPCTAGLIENKKLFQSLHLPSNAVLFNVGGRHCVDAMFYTGLPVYGFIPSQEQYEEAVKKGKKCVVFKGMYDYLPPYMLEDKNLLVIEAEIRRCE